MKDLKPRSIVLIVALACVAFVIGIVIAAPPEDNPGRPFEQLEAKLDAIEIKLDNVASQASVDVLELKLDVIEPKLDALESKLDSLESKLDSLLPPG